MTLLIINQDNFEKHVLKNQKTILIDFWSEYCAPCKSISLILEEISVEMKNLIEIGKVSIDENPELAEKFSIRSVPTLLIFKEGKVISSMIGLVAKNRLINWINISIQQNC